MNIRIVNINGHYFMHHVLVDEDNVVEKVLEEVELRGSNFGELRTVMVAIDDARKQPVIVLNAGNKKMLCG